MASQLTSKTDSRTESKSAAKAALKSDGKVAAAKKAPAGASVADGGSNNAEGKLNRLLRLNGEGEAEKIFSLLKTHGLNRTQVVSIVENIRMEEAEMIFSEKVANGELQTNQEDLMDEADLASSDIEQGMKMRMANRENFKLKRLHRALDKIRDGSYGECDSCGLDIGFARLSARTIAELCIACKEEEERKENTSAVGRKPKSLGHGLGTRLSAN